MDSIELRKMYKKSLHDETLSLGKIAAFVAIFISPLFYLKDVTMTKYAQPTLIWRLLPFVMGIGFLILLYSKHKNNHRLVTYYYLSFLYSILVMMFGIFYLNYGELNNKFNSFLIAGLITTMLLIHIFSSPVRKYIGIFPISVIFFFAVLFFIKGGDSFIISNLLNPLMIIGLIWVISNRIEKNNFSEFKLKFLLELNERDLRNEIEYRKNIEKELKEEIVLDPLTGVYNRRAAEKIIPEKIKESKGSFHKFSLAYIDIDNLKIINDRDGHDAGDKLIINFTSIVKNHLSNKDYIFKVGGDEFIMLFIDKYLTDARETIDNISVECNRNQISFSFGMSTIKNKDNLSMADLIKEADIKMYNHKKKKKETSAKGAA